MKEPKTENQHIIKSLFYNVWDKVSKDKSLIK